MEGKFAKTDSLCNICHVYFDAHLCTEEMIFFNHSFDLQHSKLDCDFESGTCGWLNYKHDDFDWIRWNGNTANVVASTGPAYDHTLGKANWKLAYH